MKKPRRTDPTLAPGDPRMTRRTPEAQFDIIDAYRAKFGSLPHTLFLDPEKVRRLLKRAIKRGKPFSEAEWWRRLEGNRPRPTC